MDIRLLFVVCSVHSSLCNGQTTHSEGPTVCVCVSNCNDLETSTMRWPRTELSCIATERTKNNLLVVCHSWSCALWICFTMTNWKAILPYRHLMVLAQKCAAKTTCLVEFWVIVSALCQCTWSFCSVCVCKFLAKSKMTLVPHPPYSSDLGPHYFSL
jgi:hypothetical protein